MSLQQQQQKAVAQNNNGGPLQKTPPKSSKTANGSASGSNGSHSKKKVSDKEREKAERESLVLWYHPIQTVKYSTLESVELMRTYGKKSVYFILFTSEIFVCVFYGAHIKLIGFDCLFHRTLENKLAIAIFVAVIAVFSTLYHIPGNHQALVTVIRTNLWFVVYWVGLGVLSSVGLGTGLHTFLLYLGPHIASVTLAAYECNSLNFPSPPYPDE